MTTVPVTKRRRHRKRAAYPATDVKRIRQQIDRVDRRLFALLARRVRLSLRAKDAKAAVGLPLRDGERESAILARARAYARARGLDAVTFQYAVDSVIEMCVLAQQNDGAQGQAAA
jgi:chorismate mutase